MLIKVFTLRFSNSIEDFDDESLRAFMADKEIVSIKDNFFVKDNIPYWSVMVMYRPGPVQSELALTYQKDKEKKEKDNNKKLEYMEYLTEESTPLFNFLREWRNETARKAGMPEYVMFTNKQLALIAGKKPENLSQLATVEGVGKAKLEKYGRHVLELVKSLNRSQKEELKQKETQQKESQQKETQQKESQQKETQQKESQQKETQQKESQQKESQQKETQQKESQQKETQQKKPQ